MKFLVATLFTLLLAFVCGLFFPWWSIAIASLLAALFVHQDAIRAFLSGFFGLFVLWAGLAWWIDMKNNGVLSHKIAGILPLGGNSILLILVTGIVAGIVAGLAALSGSYLRSPASMPS
jgi:hypothetical protein